MSQVQLRQNLAALGKRDPDLEYRIRLPVGSDHVRVPKPGVDGPVVYRFGRDWVKMHLSRAAARQCLPAPAESTFVFGVGLGETVKALLARDRRAKLVVWDRDPWMIRMALSRLDLARVLRKGQVRFAMGADLLDHLSAEAIAAHPLFTRVYRNEWQLVQRGVGERRALVCAGELLVDDLADALGEFGYSSYSWDVGRLSEEELERTAKRFEPHLVASINLTHGLTEACHRLGLPLLAWEIDPSTDRLAPKTPTGHAHLFTYRKAHVPEYRAAGFEHVTYMPLATNPLRRLPLGDGGDRSYRAPVSFVGSTMVRQVPAFRERFKAAYRAWKEGAEDEEAQRIMEQVLSVQRLDFSRYVLPSTLAEAVPGLCPWALQHGHEDPAALLGEIAAAEKRLNTLVPLGRFGLRVWGDEGWKLIEDAGVRYMGYAGHGEEISRIYSSSLINVDISRLYQNDIVTMRVFDVLACGGLLLAERNAALDELFRTAYEVETWGSVGELVDKVDWYVRHPDQAEEIAGRGRRRVLEDHTIADRVREMLEAVGMSDAALPVHSPVEDR